MVVSKIGRMGCVSSSSSLQVVERKEEVNDTPVLTKPVPVDDGTNVVRRYQKWDILHHKFSRVDVNDSVMRPKYIQDRQRGTPSTMSTTTETITKPRSASIKLTTTAEMPSPSHPNNPPKSQKQMTKAERREQQEAQRAAKAAAKATVAQTATSKPGPSHKQNASISGKGAAPSSASIPKKSGKDATTKAAKGEPKEALHPGSQLDETPRGLRIFSHFGIPKSPAITKGDIHPAIIRLGLQFAEFKITGANARCIAMLTAFKTVRHLFLTCLSMSLMP